MTHVFRAMLVLLLLSSTPSWAQSIEERAWQHINEGALLIDVRTPQEFTGGHLNQALLIPHNEISEQFKQLEIRKDRAIVLYCRSGNRAGIAERELRQAGYSNIINAGGFRAMASHPAAR